MEILKAQQSRIKKKIDNQLLGNFIKQLNDKRMKEIDLANRPSLSLPTDNSKNNIIRQNAIRKTMLEKRLFESINSPKLDT